MVEHPRAGWNVGTAGNSSHAGFRDGGDPGWRAREGWSPVVGERAFRRERVPGPIADAWVAGCAFLPVAPSSWAGCGVWRRAWAAGAAAVCDWLASNVARRRCTGAHAGRIVRDAGPEGLAVVGGLACRWGSPGLAGRSHTLQDRTLAQRDPRPVVSGVALYRGGGSVGSGVERAPGG